MFTVYDKSGTTIYQLDDLCDANQAARRNGPGSYVERDDGVLMYRVGRPLYVLVREVCRPTGALRLTAAGGVA